MVQDALSRAGPRSIAKTGAHRSNPGRRRAGESGHKASIGAEYFDGQVIGAMFFEDWPY